ncbi:MAG: hypothetical protein ACOCVY_00215 [Patescibacteria group bacterium]
MFNKKEKIIIYFFFGIILLIIMLFFVFTKNQNLSDKPENLTNENEKEIVKDQDSLEDDKKSEDSTEDTERQSRQEIDNIYAKAQKSNSIDECQNIKNKETKDHCIMNLALSNDNNNDCEVISDERIKQDCINNIYLKQAKSTQDISVCEKMLSDKYKEKCVASVVNEIDDPQNIEICNTLEGEAKSTCRDRINFNLAIKEQDMKACEEINSELERKECINKMIFELKLRDTDECQKNLNGVGVEYCKEKLTKFLNSEEFDFDQDGLSNAEEKKHGTDPYLEDTDGDGYNDKEEVEKGYNPSGN